MMSNTFRYSPEVSRALSVGEAVVALESTVITHGLPYPENQETALLMEAAVRSGGAIPATIALIAGRAIIGLSNEEIDYLAVQEQGKVRKCSLRDLSPVVAGGLDGSTTVAATMLLAHRAGIEVFATGDILSTSAPI
jgi:pseudouridine-5'-phosphate glycosidase